MDVVVFVVFGDGVGFYSVELVWVIGCGVVVVGLFGGLECCCGIVDFVVWVCE